MSVRRIVLALLLAAATPAAAADPAIGTPTVFASGLDGPEGIAATRRGHLVVGTSGGEVLRIDDQGAVTSFASTGDPLAGVTVLKDDRIVACGFAANRVWVIDTDGTPTVLASGMNGPNYALQERRRGRIYVSASNDGTIVDVTSGTPVVVASGFVYPNGLAIGKEGGQRFLYVAETFLNQISRVFLNTDGTLGAAELYTNEAPLADGLAFDKQGNLLVVGANRLSVVDRVTRAVTVLTDDAPLFWPSNLAFGRRREARRTLFLANFGLPLGDGTEVLAVPYSIRGARVVR
jgi:sugar lactone lactonase YvrE